MAVKNANRTQKIQMNEQNEYPCITISQVEKPGEGFSVQYLNIGLNYEGIRLEGFGITCHLDKQNRVCFSNVEEKVTENARIFPSENVLSAGSVLVVPSNVSSHATSHSIMASIEINPVKKMLTIKDLDCQDIVIQVKRKSLEVLPQKRG